MSEYCALSPHEQSNISNAVHSNLIFYHLLKNENFYHGTCSF